MKVSSRLLVLGSSLLFLIAAVPSRGQTGLPVVANPLPDLTVPAGTARSVINLRKTFAFDGVSGKAVRFTTTMGNIDVELLTEDAPETVANFLNYVNRGDYNGTFFHRSVQNFIIQGGGYRIDEGQLATVPAQAPVVNEFKVSNTRGTLAMAKIGGNPNSATNQWFFNESDNNAGNLDNQNGGFTVFGRIIGSSISVMDDIAALPIFNAGSTFSELPLAGYPGGDAPLMPYLVYVERVAVLPLTPKAQGEAALLKLKVKDNSNPDLVVASIDGRKLILQYQAGRTGSAVIRVMAKDGAKNKTFASFTVTVQ
jgi:cyclophilin family peptidyl-prolyl cis-trans isomerase